MRKLMSLIVGLGLFVSFAACDKRDRSVMNEDPLQIERGVLQSAVPPNESWKPIAPERPKGDQQPGEVEQRYEESTDRFENRTEDMEDDDKREKEQAGEAAEKQATKNREKVESFSR
jgi:hypothetical protein